MRRLLPFEKVQASTAELSYLDRGARVQGLLLSAWPQSGCSGRESALLP